MTSLWVRGSAKKDAAFYNGNGECDEEAKVPEYFRDVVAPALRDHTRI